MADVLPLQLMTLYQELVDAHLSSIPGDLPSGAPYRRTVGGKVYWYATGRTGSRVRQRYIGPDTPTVRERVAAIEEQRRLGEVFDRRCGDMVAQLRSARLPTLDAASGSLLSTLSAVGAFDVGGTLVGTMAFRQYDAELGRRLSRLEPAQMQDVDIASYEGLSLAVGEEGAATEGDVPRALLSHGLELSTSLDIRGRSGRWRRKTGEAAVDFLAPSFDREEEIVWLKSMGVWAQSLPFLNYLLADPLPAVGLYRHGVLLRIPRPERFAIHKLIVAHQRSGPGLAKRRKDLGQARALILTLSEDRPAELRAAYEGAMSHGQKWRDAIFASLSMIDDVRHLL